LKVVIADDHHIVRDAVQIALLRDSGFSFDIVAQVDNGLDAVVAVRTHEPDLLILDISMPLATGAEIVADVFHWSAKTKILVLTGIVAPGVLATMVDAGVQGMFSKTAPFDVLLEKLPLILQGGRYIDADLIAAVNQGQQSAKLTPRELQTLNLLMRGKSNKEMAKVLSISAKTVEKHRASLMRKLDAHTTAELMSRALQEGLIESH